MCNVIQWMREKQKKKKKEKANNHFISLDALVNPFKWEIKKNEIFKIHNWQLVAILSFHLSKKKIPIEEIFMISSHQRVCVCACDKEQKNVWKFIIHHHHHGIPFFNINITSSL